MSMHTVARGDCLWSIAQRYLSNGARWTEIADLEYNQTNFGISRSKTVIQPGWVLWVNDGGASPVPDPPPPTPPEEKKNNSNKANITFIGLVAGSTREVFVAWTWDKEQTNGYELWWDYHIQGHPNDKLNGSKTTVEGESMEDYKSTTWSAPENATDVMFWVRPISKKHDVNGTDTAYWTAEWSTVAKYDFSNNPPLTPDVPECTLNLQKMTLTATLDNIATNINADYITFNIYMNDQEALWNRATVKIVSRHASAVFKVCAGARFKVAAYAHRGSDCIKSVQSEMTDFTENYVTQPTPPPGFTECKATSETTVLLKWAAIDAADSYTIQWVENKDWFDTRTPESTQVTNNQVEITGLASGKEYFFRMGCTNEAGDSEWSKISSCICGKIPAAPTTYSSTTTAVTGELVTMYWIHNSEDGSEQKTAEVDFYVNDVQQASHIVTGDTGYWEFDTSRYSVGAKIKWRVRTWGVMLDPSPWSIMREIEVFAQPTLSVTLRDSYSQPISYLTHFPLMVSALYGPSTQTPISYHVEIVSNEDYDTSDTIGNFKHVSAGEAVYSNNFDIGFALELELSAYHVNLDNNISYTCHVTVSMDSGLTAEDSREFVVAWDDVEYNPNAEIGYDADTLVTYILPFCVDEDGTYINDLTLSVYRREFDGSFVEIASEMDNNGSTYCIDPHPSLDYARYRIVGVDETTGAISYYDVPGYPIGNPCIVIQWDEQWSTFEAIEGTIKSNSPYSGSVLKLPYNVDVSESNDQEVELIDYAGRKHSVSYYGTHLGYTATWNCEVPKDDKETLYELRRLQTWMGDVYVREPSGTGYWANIKVSFSQKHRAMTIPVTFQVTRVEGGI